MLDSCYWARLKGVSGSFDEIIANDNAVGQFYIEVLDSDGYLEIDCEITSITEWPVPSNPLVSLGPGTYAVGREIAPGIYAGMAGQGVLDSCYWARLKGVSGSFDEINANDNAVGQFYIEVRDSDGYLEIDCEIISIAEWPTPSVLLSSLDPGTYLVGRDIASGTYRGETGEGILDSCYWERLSGLTGEFGHIIANDNANGQFYVKVLPSDRALNTSCYLERVE